MPFLEFSQHGNQSDLIKTCQIMSLFYSIIFWLIRIKVKVLEWHQELYPVCISNHSTSFSDFTSTNIPFSSLISITLTSCLCTCHTSHDIFFPSQLKSHQSESTLPYLKMQPPPNFLLHSPYPFTCSLFFFRSCQLNDIFYEFINLFSLSFSSWI